MTKGIGLIVADIRMPGSRKEKKAENLGKLIAPSIRSLWYNKNKSNLFFMPDLATGPIFPKGAGPIPICEKEVITMEWLAFIFSVVALALSIWAVKRTGVLAEMKPKVDALSSLGLTEMKKQVESLSSLGESLRAKTADTLSRLEEKVRGEEKGKDKMP